MLVLKVLSVLLLGLCVASTEVIYVGKGIFTFTCTCMQVFVQRRVGTTSLVVQRAVKTKFKRRSVSLLFFAVTRCDPALFRRKSTCRCKFTRWRPSKPLQSCSVFRKGPFQPPCWFAVSYSNYCLTFLHGEKTNAVRQTPKPTSSVPLNGFYLSRGVPAKYN